MNSDARYSGKLTTPSQGFHCLSINSILDEIGFENNDIMNMLPPTPETKRKMFGESATQLSRGTQKKISNFLILIYMKTA